MSTFYDCLTAVQTVIQGANLTGLDDDHVIIRKLPWVRGADLPAVIVSPVSDTWNRTNNEQIEVGYGCHVVIVQASNQNLTSSHDAFRRWRELAEDALVDDKLTSVSEVINVLIEPSGLILPQAFRKQYDASAFVARCIAREAA